MVFQQKKGFLFSLLYGMLLSMPIGCAVKICIYRYGCDYVHIEDDRTTTVHKESNPWYKMYSPTFQTSNTAIGNFHFITPFLLNLLPSIVLISQKSREQANLERDRGYNEILRTQLGGYKHLLIAPIVLVILAIPHLILSVASQCLKFNSNS